MMRRPSLKKSGFTLFEILVAMAIMGLVLGIVVSNMSDFLELDMKKAANKLAATMRYIYNKSATEGCYIRLIIDFQEQTYWVEATTDPVLVEKEDESDRKRSKKEDKKKKEEQEKKEKEGKKDGEKEAAEAKGEEAAEGEGPKKLKPKEPVFGQVDSSLLRPTRLPETIYFKDVYVEHLSAPVDGGKVAIFFFPNGYVEKAVINLRDENDELVYSLKTSPLSGEVGIENYYRNFDEGE